jgi:hypothetical protein
MRDNAAVQEPTMVRYGFNIRTKTGQRVDNIQIMAATSGDAERRLRQMYIQCEIIECREQSVSRRTDAAHKEYHGPRARLVAPGGKTGTH